ncbi:MAG TPA: hypothetical protein VH704_00620 [Casimicrobiaceae bacterium]|jgi:hypothetical protein|nr:hypothetical protein [Casimicrobiaceae bacterium]
MKLGAPSLVLAGLFLACSSAAAQGQAANNAPVASAAVPPAASAPPPPTDPRRDAHADARKCLEFPTELQVIACAEKYRPARKR